MCVCVCVCQTREIAHAVSCYGHFIPAYVNIMVWRFFPLLWSLDRTVRAKLLIHVSSNSNSIAYKL